MDKKQIKLDIQNIFIKVLGSGGKKIVVKDFSEFKNAVEELGDNKLTFAFGLPFEHHCTISFIDMLRGNKLYDAAKKFFEVYENDKKDLHMIPTGIDKLAGGKVNVILLKFSTDTMCEAFRLMNLAGTPESDCVICHMSYWMDGSEERISYVKSIVSLF